MSRYQQEIRKEIQRIEGQLLVAKQICRENVVIHTCFVKSIQIIFLLF